MFIYALRNWLLIELELNSDPLSTQLPSSDLDVVFSPYISSESMLMLFRYDLNSRMGLLGRTD